MESEELYKTYFSRLKENDKKQKCEEIQYRLDAEKLLYFGKTIKVKSLYDLLHKFFYERLKTYFANTAGLQTSALRRRSIIDFYLIQKYYLEQPYTLEECSDLYFKLPRFSELRTSQMLDAYKAQRRTKENIEASMKSLLTHKLEYYCGVVRRNVFVCDGDFTTDSLAKILGLEEKAISNDPSEIIQKQIIHKIEVDKFVKEERKIASDLKKEFALKAKTIKKVICKKVGTNRYQGGYFELNKVYDIKFCTIDPWGYVTLTFTDNSKFSMVMKHPAFPRFISNTLFEFYTEENEKVQTD